MVVGKRFGGATTKDENEWNDECRKALRDSFRFDWDICGVRCTSLSKVVGHGRIWEIYGKDKELDHKVGGWLEENK